MTETSKDSLSSGPERPSMLWAALAASAIPMAVGLIGLYFCYVPTEIGRGFYQDYIFSIPVALCFACGTPLVAWLSCRDLAHRADTDKANRFRLLGVGLVAIKYGFYVHACAFLIHVTLVAIFMGEGDAVEAFLYCFMIGAYVNAILFVLITMPLSVLCAAIFSWLYPAPK